LTALAVLPVVFIVWAAIAAIRRRIERRE